MVYNNIPLDERYGEVRFVHMRLDRDSRIPLFIQIEQQIRHQILSGKYGPGTKLPSSRELSQFLHVNRQTIANALEILARERLIEIRQGAGVFVLGRKNQSDLYSQELIHLAENVVRETRRAGYSCEDLIKAIALVEQTSASENLTSEQYIVFVECNQLILNSYQKDIERELNIKVATCLLDEICQATPAVLAMLSEAAMVVTTFTHLYQVKKELRKHHIDVIGLAAGPYMDLMLSIRKWPSTSEITIVCVLRRGAQEVALSIADSRGAFASVKTCGSDDPGCEDAVRGSQYLVISRAIYDKVQPWLSDGQNVLIFENVLDRASLNMLKNMIENYE